MAQKGSKKEPQNPYMAGRLEWNERYGSLIVREKRWRLMAFISSLITLVAVIGVVYIGSQSKYIPYIVEVDKLGNIQASGRADQVEPSSARIKRAALQDFITNVRSVYVDAAAMRSNVEKAYAIVPNGGAAYQTLTEFFRERKPFQMARTKTVSVDVQSTLPVSEKTWQVEWIETVRDRNNGDIIKTSNHRAVITLDDVIPDDKEGIVTNPAGINLESLNWTEVN